MKTRYVALLTIVVLVAATFTLPAQEEKPEAKPADAQAPAKARIDWDLPAGVVETVPADRAMDVDPNITELKVVFDRPMVCDRDAWSWVALEKYGAYPGIRGFEDPRWLEDERTIVLPVQLEPDTVYAIAVNSFQHTGFMGRDQKPAEPYSIVFKTKKK